MTTRKRCTRMLPIPTVAVLGNEVTAQMPHATSATVVARPREDATMLAAEQVAGVVAGISTLGEACDALSKAGWRASIAGNRSTANDEVFAQFIGATVGSPGGIAARWVIYRIAGTPPVWVVGADYLAKWRSQAGHVPPRTSPAPLREGLIESSCPFGVLDSNRIDVKREQFRGHLLDRQMLELIRAG
jgi:hypothetical protein